MVYFINGVYEFGDETPLRIKCEDGHVTLEDMISKEQIKLLDGLFSGRDMNDHKDQLDMLDKYLNIPLVEAYFNPTSYKAFHRLVDNKCSIIPNYDPTELKFCQEAAKQNHSETLKRAYEIGCHWDSIVISYAFSNGNRDMVQYIIDHHGPVSYWILISAVKSKDIELVRLAFSLHQEQNTKTEFDFNCYQIAAQNQDVQILEFMQQHSPLKDFETWNDLEERIDMYEYITSAKVFQFFYAYYREKLRNRNVYLFRNAVNSNDSHFLSLVREASWDHINTDVWEYIFENDKIPFETLRQILWTSKGVLPDQWNSWVSISTLRNFNLLEEYYVEHPYVSTNNYMTATPHNNSRCVIIAKTLTRLVCNGKLEILQRILPKSLITTSCDENYKDVSIVNDGSVLFFHKIGVSTHINHWNIIMKATNLADAIRGNHMDMVKFLVENKCTWPQAKECNIAHRNHYYPMLKYIHEQGFPCDGSCHTYYHPNRIPFCQKKDTSTTVLQELKDVLTNVSSTPVFQYVGVTKGPGKVMPLDVGNLATTQVVIYPKKTRNRKRGKKKNK